MSDVSDKISNVQFKTVRLREGYDMSEVDRFLEEIGGRSALSSPARSGNPDPVGSQVVQEQEGLLAWLFGRGSS